MTLFFDDAYEELRRKLIQGLRFLRSWDEDWQVPTASALPGTRQPGRRAGAVPSPLDAVNGAFAAQR